MYLETMCIYIYIIFTVRYSKICIFNINFCTHAKDQENLEDTRAHTHTNAYIQFMPSHASIFKSLSAAVISPNQSADSLVVFTARSRYHGLSAIGSIFTWQTTSCIEVFILGPRNIYFRTGIQDFIFIVMFFIIVCPLKIAAV